METQEMVDLCLKHTMWSWSARSKVKPLPIQRAEGIYLYTPDGERIIDFNSQLMSVNIGHSHPKVLEDPAPVVKVSNLGDSSVDFVVRPWTNTSDYWDVYWDLTKSIKKRLDAEGLNIPFPQRDIHIISQPT